MRNIQKVFLLLVTISLSHLAIGQQIQQFIDEDYETENVFGIVKATNGGLISGFYFRHSSFLGNNNLSHWGIEMVNIKHPREAKQTTFTGSSYVFGKSNYFVSLRPTYGREKILFKKAPQQGARVTALVAGGPAIGMEIPYYIEISQNQKEQYDPHNNQHAIPFIVGSAGPFRGLGQTKFVLGLHAKASLTFETNSTKKRVFGFEMGFTADVYTREIEILPLADNQSVYTAAFIAIYFGKRR
ncbi:MULTISPECIES: hypothetical protein [Roseivirga]|uniref:Outer membrane protein beta-barrel domain-containing protein n=1 Tax=Roseivirga thermotolerans TaxID=1758176 RepID=A0ABQ3HZA4_9BACT|nr:MULTISPECIES: hypothetical protein [Roseivirga]MEC7756172.1 hypothetical protein [Bacteroidota bacterium]GHE50343.1 hypothetical protein GCM10011340_00170 [Roseivirga thermotolerans]|tara:strand:- start:913 stop:1638 length:726 start_codon:yes stop_codon:yes gene_type:complete